jgi:dolichol-phosphate mannosyltransferase
MGECNWAAVVPLANEEKEFDGFIFEISKVLDRLESGTVYLVVDRVSTDATYDLCRALSCRDQRFVAVWAPENRNVVDAYLRGMQEAWNNEHEIIIEMDAGLSHNPQSIPLFIRALNEGNECAFGSRYIDGGSMADSPLKRRFLSRGGTILAKLMLGTHFSDMTSGYEGFHARVVQKLLNCRIRSTAHFYQTEVRYLLREHRYVEIPIHYKAPSPRVSRGAIKNSLQVLLYYFLRRLFGRSALLK